MKDHGVAPEAGDAGLRTMQDLLGLTKDDLIDGLEEPAGATTALLEAQDAVSLFI